MIDALLFMLVVGTFVSAAKRVVMPAWVAMLVGTGTWIGTGLVFDAATLGLDALLSWPPEAVHVLHTWVEPCVKTVAIGVTATTLRRRERRRVRAVHRELLASQRARD